jgi:Short C-terminal domain
MRQRKGTLSFFMVAGAAFAIVGIAMLVIGLSSGNFISNMGLTITGGTFAMIGIIWVAVAVGVGGWYGSVASKQAKEQQLFQTGQRATAVIEGVEGTGMSINDQPQVYLTLRVKPRNGQEFIHQRKLVLPFGSIVQPGYLVDVAYDPANPDNVAIETDSRYTSTPPAVYIKTRPPDQQAQPLAAAPAVAQPVSSGSPPTLIEQIERLAKLRDSGALTEAEFQEQKRQLLEG